jgi:soluble lytic murein transglycosylase-like protein
MPRPIALAVLLALAVPPPGIAGVEVRTSAAGRVVITNESEADRGRRLASRLVAPPQVDLVARIAHFAAENELDPKLVQAVIQAESGYNRLALSNKGAMGLMQLMPGTAAELAVTDPYDIDQNLSAGTRYLRRLLDAFGQTELALAAYNAGPGAVERHDGVPPYAETKAYIRRILSLWHGKPMTLTGARLGGRSVEWRRSAGGRPVLTNQR